MILYSGLAAAGRHPLAEVLAAARRLARERPEALFVLVGGSEGLLDLERRARNEGLANIVRWDRVTAAELEDLFAMADVHLASLSAAATGTCVPSKVYAAMAAARPVALLASGDGQAALDVRSAGAGFVVGPGDGDGLADRLASLTSAEADLLGRRGRVFFLAERELQAAVREWRKLLAASGARATA